MGTTRKLYHTIKMRKKIIILGIVLAVIDLGLYLGVNTKSVPPVSAEDLIKQSASQMLAPGLQARKQPIPKLTPAKSEEICTGKDVQNFRCYDKYYSKLTASKGVAAAFADLKVRYAKSAYVKSQCHPITHVIGNSAAILYPDVGVAFSHGDSFCWSGYYHGIMEGVVAQSSLADVTKKINNICEKIPGKERYSFDYYNCVHGLGHGIMASNQDELFDALKFCDNLVGGWEKSSCWGGVFMENIIIDNKGETTKFLKPSDLLYPCNAVGNQYKSTCYLMQTSYMLKVTGGDFAKVFDLCGDAGFDYRITCYNSLGRDASGRSVSNVQITKQTCDLGKDFEQKSNCVIGAVKDFISYYHSEKEATVFCNSLAPDLQKICSDTAISYYKTL